MNSTLYLHIGLPKSGTSAIQRFLGCNRAVLEKKGVVVPGDRVGENLHHDIALQASIMANAETARKKLRSTIEPIASLGERIVLSSEVFAERSYIHIEVLEEFTSHFSTILVIVYLRRGDTMIESAYNQMAKRLPGIATPLEEKYFDKYYDLVYTRKLAPFVQMFGKDNIVVRPFEKNQFIGRTIFSDFLSCIDVEPDLSFVIPEGRVNPSLTPDTLEYKRLVNTVCTPKEARVDFADPLIRYSEQERETYPSDHEHQYLLSPLERISLLKQLETDYALIAHEYLGREDGRLFYDPLPDPNEPWQPYPGLRTEKTEAITQFLYDRRPDLVKSLCQRLSAAGRETDEYIAEAQDILLPPLERVLARGALGKKVNIMKTQPTIYLHVGTAKTGTTALQHFIGENLDRFAEYGYYYPKTGRVNNCHHGIAFYWGNQDAFKRRFDVHEDQLTRLYDELHAHQDKHILISSECLLLPTVNWEDFLSVLPHDNIKIIVYFRRQDSFLTSRYMEIVKGNQIILPPAEWIGNNFYPNEYLGILKRLSSYVGKNNIIVRVYERQQFVGGSIFSDFCDILSIPLRDDFVISERNFNPHLSRNALDFNRLVNTVFDDRSSPYIFNSVLTQFSLVEKPDNNVAFRNHGLFSPGKCREILTACENVNTKIAREYLGREDGRLFYEQPPDPDEPWEPYPGLSQEKAEEIVSFLFDKTPQLTVRLYHALTKAVSDEPYLQKAKEILLPPLSNVISISDRQFSAKKNDPGTPVKQEGEVIE